MDYSPMMPKCSSEGSGESLLSITALFRLWIMWRMRCVLPLKFHFSLCSCCHFMPGFFLGMVTWAPSFDGVVTGHCHANLLILILGVERRRCRHGRGHPHQGSLAAQHQRGRVISHSDWLMCQRVGTILLVGRSHTSYYIWERELGTETHFR